VYNENALGNFQHSAVYGFCRFVNRGPTIAVYGRYIGNLFRLSLRQGSREKNTVEIYRLIAWKNMRGETTNVLRQIHPA